MQRNPETLSIAPGRRGEGLFRGRSLGVAEEIVSKSCGPLRASGASAALRVSSRSHSCLITSEALAVNLVPIKTLIGAKFRRRRADAPDQADEHELFEIRTRQIGVAAAP